MFSDPLTLHSFASSTLTSAQFLAGTSALSFVRTGSGPDKATYRYKVDTDTWYDLTISHSVNARRRFLVRMDEHDVVANPLDTSKNVIKTSSLYLVHDVPLAFDSTTFGIMAAGLSEFLVSGSDFTRYMTRVINGEI